MKRALVGILSLVLVSAAAGWAIPYSVPAPAAQPTVAGAESVDVFSRFIGEWTIDGAWDSGEPLHARTIYAWGLANKSITCKTFVTAQDKEYQRYEGVMTWHPRKKTLTIYTFAFDGEVSEHRVTASADGAFKIGFTPWDSDDPANVRQTLRFTGDNEYVWTVELKKNDQWTRLIEGTWHRKR